MKIKEQIIHKYGFERLIDIMGSDIDIDDEVLRVQTQHQDGDLPFQKFVKDFAKLAKALSEEKTFLGIPVKR